MADFEFPYDPYPLQLKFMKEIYECIDSEQIGIFQSPTGTGKSLSLLCGSLSWLMSRNFISTSLEIDSNPDADADENVTPQWVIDWQRKKLEETCMKRFHEQVQFDLDDDQICTKRKVSSGPPIDQDEFILQPYFDGDTNDHRSTLDIVRQEYEQALVRSHAPADPSQQDHLKILFCSRTHSQLTQLIEELRKTSFSERKGDKSACRVVALGSRKQLCVNPAVQRLKSVERMNDECVDLQKKRGCPYLPKKGDENSDDKRLQQFQRTILSEIHDIEDLVQKGKHLKTCPYYAVRDAVPPAQLVTLPYSMLLSPVTRRSLGISLKNNIVIIDEAHNLVDATNQLNSIQVSLRDLDETRQHLQTYLKKYQQRLLGMNVVYIKQLLLVLSRICADFNVRFSQRRQKRSDSSLADSVSSIADYVHCLKIDHINLFKIQKYLEDSQLAKKLNGFVEKHIRGSADSSVSVEEGADEYSPKHTSPLYQIEAFLMMLNNPEVDGKILIHVEPESKKQMNSENTNANSTQTNQSSNEERICRKKSTIQFLLLNPANYFKDVVEEARSIILAGGTMDPLDDLIQQLFPGIPSSKIRTFSSEHIIDPGNLQTLIIGQGPTSIPFEFSFEKRKNVDMIREAGETVLNVSRIVPGGVVVFFASFQYLEYVLDEWKRVRVAKVDPGTRQKTATPIGLNTNSQSIWDRLRKVKKLFVEPRSSVELDKCLKEYSDAILLKDTPPEDQLTSIPHAQNTKTNGAILFSVVGGKMSEGINFANDLGRAVIMMGVPFPNLHSPELREKMRYMDITAVSNGKKDGVVDGKEYYENVCMRAVNQSIGRAIRHRNDYACVLLLDKRYAQPRIKQKLPAWMKQSISDLTGSPGQFGEMMRKLSTFFKFHKQKQQD